MLQSLTRALGDGAFLDGPRPADLTSSVAPPPLPVRAWVLGGLGRTRHRRDGHRGCALVDDGRRSRPPSPSPPWCPRTPRRPPPFLARTIERRSRSARRANRAQRDRRRDPPSRRHLRTPSRRKFASCREPSSSSTPATPRTPCGRSPNTSGVFRTALSRRSEWRRASSPCARWGACPRRGRTSRSSPTRTRARRTWFVLGATAPSTRPDDPHVTAVAALLYGPAS